MDRSKSRHSSYDGFVAGRFCTVNRNNDIAMEFDIREFIDARCIIVKITKGGLIQIKLESNPNMTYSVPKKNVDII